MVNESSHLSSVFDSNPSCLVSANNKFYNPSTLDWGMWLYRI